MAVRIEPTADGITAWVSGEIDHHTARVLRERIDAAIATKKPKVLRLDFSGVGFMDSSGIGLVMGRYRLVNAYGGVLRVVGASDRLLRVMKLAGLERLPVWETPPVSIKRKEARKV
ncbi:MAG: STAS domain-containing protein [Clostridia bacterium]|nr:STAS domain-containing protein [Clostridia bacterium]